MNATEHVEEILRNPLAIFSVIHRCARLLRNLSKQQREDRLIPGQVPNQSVYALGPVIQLNEALYLICAFLVPLTELKKQFANDSWPLQKDLADAAEAILQIQFVYNLKAADVRNVPSALPNKT